MPETYMDIFGSTRGLGGPAAPGGQAYQDLRDKPEGWSYEQWRRNQAGTGIQYNDQTEAALQQQLAASRQLYAGATDESMAAGAISRGQALSPHVAQVAGGDALSGRLAIMGGGQAAMGAGAEATMMGSEDRLAATDEMMRSETQRAKYEQMAWDTYWKRRTAYEDAQRRVEAARAAEAAGEAAMTRQMVGTALGTGGAAASASTGYGGGGGGGGGQQQQGPYSDYESMITVNRGDPGY